MDSESLDALLSYLPRQQHQRAKRKITLAEAAGYSGIFLWFFTGWEPHVSDLCGTDAKGKFWFLAEPEDYP